MTLYDHVMSSWMYQCTKHNLHHDSEEYAREQFDKLTPSEQLKLISDALEEMK